MVEIPVNSVRILSSKFMDESSLVHLLRSGSWGKFTKMEAMQSQNPR